MTTDDKKVHLNSLIRVPVGKLISAENICSLRSGNVIKVKKEFSYQAWKLLSFKCIFVNLTGAGAGGPWLVTMSPMLDRKQLRMQCNGSTQKAKAEEIIFARHTA